MAKAATAKRERKEKLEDILVVDCDVHVHESPGAIMPYCEMPWQKALETIFLCRCVSSGTLRCSARVRPCPWDAIAKR